MFTLLNSSYFAQPFVQYAPLTAGFGLEPSTSICSMIRNSLFSAPVTWYFNRNEVTFSTVVGQQDYPQSISANGNDFAFIEKVTLTDDQGNVYELKDALNNSALAVSAFQQRPSACAAQQVTYSGVTQTVKFRFLGVPDKIYLVTITYQKLAPQFGPYTIASVAAAAGGNTVYTGVFDPYSLPVGSTVIITGFKTSQVANNGTFIVGAVTGTTLTVNNTAGVLAAAGSFTAFAVNPSWSPIPDQFSDIYNNLYLSEILAANDDTRAQLYRQRGIAAFLAKSTGLSEMQRNVFLQQWNARGMERQSSAQITQQGNQGRTV
jgi:hypothetical protein